MARPPKIPTYEGRLQARNTFTTPYVAGETAIKAVGQITEIANKVADQVTIEKANAAGYEQQSAEIAAGNQDYIGGGTAFSLAGKAYQSGANVAYVAKKETDFDQQLGDLAQKRQTNPELFTKESEDLKTKLLQDTPSNLMPLLGEAYDKVRNNYSTQITAFVRNNEFQANQLKVTDRIYNEVGKISGMINTSGVAAEDLPATFISINDKLLSLKEHFGYTPKQMRAITDTIRQSIMGQYIRYEFDRLKDDPEAREKLKAQIISGEYSFGELGDELGDLIPGGQQMSFREADAFTKIFDTYEKDFIQTLVNDKVGFTNSETNKNIDYTKGRGYTLGYVGYGPNKKFGIIAPSDVEYDEVTAKALGLTNEQIAKGKFDREVALRVGQVIHKAMMSDFGTMRSVYNDIDLLEKKARETDNVALKGVYSETAKIARQELKQLIEDRETARANGTEAEFFTEQLGSMYFEGGIDLTNKEGTQEWINTYEQRYANLPFRHLGLPKSQGQAELQNLMTAQSVDELRSGAQDLINRQGEYSTMWISTGIKHMQGEDKSGAYAYQQYVNLVATGDYRTADQLATAIFQRKENIAALKTTMPVDGGDSFKTQTKEAMDKYHTEFGNGMDVRTSFAKSNMETFQTIYFKLRQVQEQDEAIAGALEFVQNTNSTIALNNGQDIVVPKSIVYDKQKNQDMHGLIKNTLEAVLKDPSSHNIQPAPGQTYDDILSDIENYTFGFDNGHFVLLNNSGDVAASVFMKMPSDDQSLFYSDALFTVDRGTQHQTAFVDIEPTWGTDTGFTNKLPETYKTDFYKTPSGDTLQAMSLAETELPDQSEITTTSTRVDQYGETVQKAFIKDYLEQTANGQTVYKYFDSHVSNFVGLSDQKNETAMGISMKIKENNFEEMDALWLAENVPYFDVLNNDVARKTILEDYKNNFAEYSQLQSKNTGATRMTPMQVIGYLVKNYEAPKDELTQLGIDLVP
jgi:hypothetical protein